MAKAKFWQNGGHLDYVNSTGSAIEANTVILYGSRIAVAGGDIQNGAKGALIVEGVFEFPKDDAAITAGAAVYWDATDSVITATSTDNTLAGYAVAAAAADDAKVLVKINA